MFRLISALIVSFLLMSGVAIAQQAKKDTEAAADAAAAAVAPAEGLLAEELACECDTEINALFVEVLDYIRRAEAVGVLPLDRYRYYRFALRGVDRIIKLYPRSWIAVRLLADQPIGNFYYTSLKRRFRLAAVEACGNEDNAPDDCRQVLSQHLQTIVVELRTVGTKVVQVTELIERLETSFNGQVDRIAALSAEVGSLKAQLASKEQEKADLNAAIAEIQALADRYQRNLRNAAKKRREAETERDQLRALLENEKARGDQLNEQLVAVQAALEGKSTGVDRADMGRLQGELLASKNQITRLEGLLRDANKRIADLGERQEVKIIDQRSGFLARISELGGVEGEEEIQGERIVFSSEVLFDSARATLRPAGKTRLDAFARAVLQAMPDIPDDVEWALQIDGHTDKLPIKTARFPSNWELSIARSLSVVHYLQGQGIPYVRLVAAGHAEFHPIDPGETREAYQRNRRVEVRFLER